MRLKIILQSITMVGVSALTVAVFSFRTTSATVPGNNTLVSTDSSGNQQTGGAADWDKATMSKDGRYIAFLSSANNLVASDTNGVDVFVKDMQTGAISRANVSSAGTQSNGSAIGAKISYDGRYVVFASTGTNLVASDTNGKQDVFLHDMVTGTTEIISATPAGTKGNDNSAWDGKGEDLAISRDGRYVAFVSYASNLVTGDTNASPDVFVRDRKLNTMTRLSVSSTGTEANNYSGGVSISCDGAIVAFNSTATNLVSSDTNGVTDLFIVNRVGADRISDATISANSGESIRKAPYVSCDGSTVAFMSGASNLVSGDTNGVTDIFTYDISAGSFERVNISSAGAEANIGSDYPAISSDGRYVVFESSATNLVSSDTNAVKDIFIRDRTGGTTERISVRNGGGEATVSDYGNISPDGKYATFISGDISIVSGDTNGVQDVFRAETGVAVCSI